MHKKSNVQIKQILNVYWQHIRRYKGAAFMVMFFIAFANALDVIAPIFYKRFFDLLVGDLVVEGQDVQTALIFTLLIVLAFHSFSWLSWRVANLTASWFQPRVGADLEQSAVDNLHNHSYRFFSNNFAGSLVRKVGRLSNSFEKMTNEIQYHFIPLTVVLFGNLIVLSTRSTLLAFLLLAWTVVFLLFNGLYAQWKLKYDFQRAEVDSEATGILADTITNAITVKFFTGKLREFALFKEVTERLRKLNTFTWRLHEFSDAVQAGLMILIEFVIMYVAVDLWQQGILTIGDFALIQGYMIGIFMKIWDFGKAIRHVFAALADADEMVKILNLPYEVKDVRRAKQFEITSPSIEFKDVSFSFNKTRRVLDKMNFTIKAKEKIALVGPSGAGKSTITKLLFRFYDVAKGKVLVDGQDISKVTQESLREHIAVVPQESILFHRSIMENIRYGRPDATDEEVIEAAKKARAHEFITQLSDVYETFVGERGVKLSGGERQRIAIARAILKNAPILVLDEATSSLDSESEILIQEALEELMKDKTTIVIAHRLSTIMKMDRILVIENGQVVDSGTHKQLLRKKTSTYKKLWDIQVGGFIQ